MRTALAFIGLVAVASVLLGQNFPQPGPGVQGFFGGSIYADATACWSFNDPTDLGNDDCTDTYDLTEVNTPLARGGANSYSTYIDDTASQMVEIADNPSLSFVGDMGICGWVDSADWPTDYLASKAFNYGSLANWEWSLRGGSLTRTDFQMSDGTTSAYARVTGTPVGSRFFVCGWRDGSAVGSEINVSVNTVVGTPGALSGTNDTTGKFRLGAGAFVSQFQGPLGPVYYWSDNPSTAVMTSLYNAGKGKLCADLTAAEKVNMVSCWDMSEDGGPYADSIGSNTLTGVNTPTRAAGLVERSDSGMSVKMASSSSQHMTDALGLDLSSSGFTLAGWFNSSSGWHRFEYDDVSSNRVFAYASDASFYVFENDSTFQSVGADPSSAPWSVGTNEWYFGAFWFDPSDKKGYVDYNQSGSSVSTTALSNPLNSATPTFKLNRQNSTYADTVYDNLALWVAVPGAAAGPDLDALYNSGAGTFYAAYLDSFFNDGLRFAWSERPEIRRIYVR